MFIGSFVWAPCEIYLYYCPRPVADTPVTRNYFSQRDLVRFIISINGYLLLSSRRGRQGITMVYNYSLIREKRMIKIKQDSILLTNGTNIQWATTKFNIYWTNPFLTDVFLYISNKTRYGVAKYQITWLCAPTLIIFMLHREFGSIAGETYAKYQTRPVKSFMVLLNRTADIIYCNVSKVIEQSWLFSALEKLYS